MAEQFPSDFTIESSLALPVDTFEARYPGAPVFLGRGADTVITLAPGFYDDVGLATVAERIVQGVVSEWEFSRAVTGGADGPVENVITRVRGYDPAKRLADAWLRKRYVRQTSPAPITTAPPIPDQPEIGAIPEVRGTFTYLDVARDACAVAGLSLAWQLPNPELQRDFTANGRALDILASLARPWANAEPRRADIYVDGTTVVVRQRDAAPAGGTPLSVDELRPVRVRLIARPPKPIGWIIVRGRSELPTDGLIVSGGTFTVEEDTATVRASYEYRDGLPPFGLLLTADKRTFQNGTQLTREQVTNDWQASVFDGGQRVNTPQPLRGFTEIQGLDDDAVLRTLRTEERLYSYNGEGFLIEERTQIKRWDKGDETLKDFELHIRTLAGQGPLLTSDVTVVYVPDGDAGFFGPAALRWREKNRTGGTGGGHRPGGPGRGRARRAGGGGTPVVVASVGTAGARSIEIRAEDLDRSMCQQIHDQLRAWGAMWEYEVEISAPTLPWLSRGAVVTLVGLTAEDGTPIPTAAMTVYDLNIRHDQSAARPSSTMTIRAGWWA
jgi:hypothetical protein